MIEADWNVAKLVLQIMAEEGPGKAFAIAQAQEDAQLTASRTVLNG